VALLVFSIWPQRFVHGHAWPIFAVVFVGGIGRSFLQPARSALSAEVVPRALYQSAVAWRSSTWQFASVVGPAMGGLLYGFAGAAVSYGVAAALVLLALLSTLPVPRSPVRAETAPESMSESLGTGLRFLRGQPVLLGAMTLDLFSVLFGGATALLPIFAADILHVGPKGLGILRAAPAVGAVLMSVTLAHRPPLRHAGRALLVAVALFGLSMIGFGLSRSFLLSLALLAISGMVDNVSVVVRSTLLQVMTPDHLLGRVSALNGIFIGSSNEIGEFESGVAARLLGVVPAVVLGGVATLAVVAITAWRIPSLRKLREIRPQA
jgi:MFS family permease